jgi:hypothetical protein
LTFARPNTLFAAPMDLGKLQVTGSAVPILEHLYYSVVAERFWIFRGTESWSI